MNPRDRARLASVALLLYVTVGTALLAVVVIPWALEAVS